ncbi:MAG: hypothetical protein PXZ08_10470 [Actinomycetota bacterium]|nr:hypothetical protein [Actinomycetota bacterium]
MADFSNLATRMFSERPLKVASFKYEQTSTLLEGGKPANDPLASTQSDPFGAGLSGICFQWRATPHAPSGWLLMGNSSMTLEVSDIWLKQLSLEVSVTGDRRKLIAAAVPVTANTATSEITVVLCQKP